MQHTRRHNGNTTGVGRVNRLQRIQLIGTVETGQHGLLLVGGFKLGVTLLRLGQLVSENITFLRELLHLLLLRHVHVRGNRRLLHRLLHRLLLRSRFCPGILVTKNLCHTRSTGKGGRDGSVAVAGCHRVSGHSAFSYLMYCFKVVTTSWSISTRPRAIHPEPCFCPSSKAARAKASHSWASFFAADSNNPIKDNKAP